MYIELKKHDFSIARKFFNIKKYHIPAMAVINNNFPGRVFVDNKENPQIAMVWALSRWSYINSLEETIEYKSFLKEVMSSEIVPILNQLHIDWFEIYAEEHINWDSIINEALDCYIIDKHYENTFTLDREKYSKIDMNINTLRDVKINEVCVPMVSEEYKNYIDEKKYKNKAYGITLEKNGQVIAQCLNNGFINNKEYFIDLDTFNKEERNKGYGTFAAYELIRRQLEKGFIPLWETTVNNVPSQRVAEKLGFQKIEEYPVYCIDI